MYPCSAPGFISFHIEYSVGDFFAYAIFANDANEVIGVVYCSASDTGSLGTNQTALSRTGHDVKRTSAENFGAQQRASRQNNPQSHTDYLQV